MKKILELVSLFLSMQAIFFEILLMPLLLLQLLLFQFLLL
nr:MAG TPA: hypothetical protein [Caudoviricetes sp.]